MKRVISIVTICAAAAGLLGCGSGTPGEPIETTLEDLWPHEDGHNWHYHQTIQRVAWDENSDIYEVMGPLFDTEEEVPPLQSIDELWDQYQSLNPPVWDLQWVGDYFLRFDGEIQLHPDEWFQVLADSTHWSETSLYAHHEDFSNPISSYPPAYGNSRDNMRGGTTFLREMRLRMTEDAIEGYYGGDFFMPWKVLEADFSLGHEFEIATHGEARLISRVTGLGFHWFDGQWIRDVLQVFYVYDLGIMGIIDVYDPEPYAYFRPVQCGVVHFALNVGPVYSHCRGLINAADPDFKGQEDSELVLYTSGY